MTIRHEQINSWYRSLQLEQVMRVERMRQAILQGIMNPEMVFAKPVLPLMQHPFGPSGMAPPLYQQNTNLRPPGAPVNPPNSGPGPRGMGRGRGLLGKGMCQHILLSCFYIYGTIDLLTEYMSTLIF